MRVILSWSKDRRRDCQIWLCEEHDFKVCNISWVWGPSLNDVGKFSEFWHPPPHYRQFFWYNPSAILTNFWPILTNFWPLPPSQLPTSFMEGPWVWLEFMVENLLYGMRKAVKFHLYLTCDSHYVCACLHGTYIYSISWKDTNSFCQFHFSVFGLKERKMLSHV